MVFVIEDKTAEAQRAAKYHLSMIIEFFVSSEIMLQFFVFPLCSSAPLRLNIFSFKSILIKYLFDSIYKGLLNLIFVFPLRFSAPLRLKWFLKQKS